MPIENPDDDDDLDTVGGRARYARKLRKMKQPELAQAIGISQGSLSDIETGETKEVTGLVLIKLAKKLRVRAEWLALKELPMEDEALQVDEQEMLTVYRRLRDSSSSHAAVQETVRFEYRAGNKSRATDDKVKRRTKR